MPQIASPKGHVKAPLSAGNAQPNTEGSAPFNGLPREALANFLEPIESQEPAQTESRSHAAAPVAAAAPPVSPPAEAGEGEETPPDAQQANAGEAESVLSQSEAEAETPAAETEAEAEAPTETKPDEESEGAEADEDEDKGKDKDLPHGVAKRIGKLLGRIEQLEKQLEGRESKAEGREAKAEEGPQVLDKVTDVAQVRQLAENAEQGLAEVDEQIANLSVAPEEVEAYFRQNGVTPKREDGSEDWSAKTMLGILRKARSHWQGIAKAAPKREQFLAEYQRQHQFVKGLVPWIDQPDNADAAAMQSIAAAMPGLKSRPDWEYWAAAAVVGHKALMAQQQQAKKNPPKIAPRVPATAGNSVAGRARVSDPRAAKQLAAKQRIEKGDRDALGEFLEPGS